jgi:hypothetical protein
VKERTQPETLQRELRIFPELYGLPSSRVSHSLNPSKTVSKLMELAGFPMEGVVISVTFRPFEAKCLEN